MLVLVGVLLLAFKGGYLLVDWLLSLVYRWLDRRTDRRYNRRHNDDDVTV